MTIAIIIAAYLGIGVMYHGYATERDYTKDYAFWMVFLANVLLAPFFIPLEIGKIIGFFVHYHIQKRVR